MKDANEKEDKTADWDGDEVDLDKSQRICWRRGIYIVVEGEGRAAVIVAKASPSAPVRYKSVNILLPPQPPFPLPHSNLADVAEYFRLKEAEDETRLIDGIDKIDELNSTVMGGYPSHP